MRNFLILCLFVGSLSFIFALPLTLNSFTSKTLYEEHKQEIINNSYTNEESADFAEIKSEKPNFEIKKLKNKQIVIVFN